MNKTKIELTLFYLLRWVCITNPALPWYFKEALKKQYKVYRNIRYTEQSQMSSDNKCLKGYYEKQMIKV